MPADNAIFHVHNMMGSEFLNKIFHALLDGDNLGERTRELRIPYQVWVGT